MGIFGYDAKEFATNSHEFKAELNKIYEKCGAEMDNRRKINLIMNQLSDAEFPGKKDTKEQRAIDERIRTIIKAMMRDVQQEKPALLSGHIFMLQSALNKSRQFGQEVCTPEEIRSQETMAECKSNIRDCLEQKKQIQIRKEEIMREAERLRGPGAEEDQAALELEYNECVANEEHLNENINAMTEIYNVNLEVINAKERVKSGKQIQQLTVVDSVAEFDRIADEGAAIFEDIHGTVGDLSDIAKRAKSEVRASQSKNTSNSGFAANLEARKNAKLENAIDGASYQAPAEQKTSAFRDALSKRQ